MAMGILFTHFGMAMGYLFGIFDTAMGGVSSILVYLWSKFSCRPGLV